MARYMIHAFCEECSDCHSMGISVALSDGPADRACVGTLFAGKGIPPNLAIMLRNAVKCPRSGRVFQQSDNNKIYIAPTPG